MSERTIGVPMTNEQIGKLEGRELAVEFAQAFIEDEAYREAHTKCTSTRRFSESLDNVLAALPDEWGWRTGTCIDGDAKYFATVWPHQVGISDFAQCEGPTPATALCRAALKAKVATTARAVSTPR